MSATDDLERVAARWGQSFNARDMASRRVAFRRSLMLFLAALGFALALIYGQALAAVLWAVIWFQAL